MKSILAAILLLVFAAQTFDKALILLDYCSNVTVYALHCENKDEPMMHCNGKCLLKKKLQREENDKQNPESNTENKNQVSLFSRSYFASLSHVETPGFTIEYPRINGDKERKMPRSLFHPPSA